MKQRLVLLARRINRWSGFLQVTIGFVGVLTGILLAAWAIRSGEQTARRSGNFERPNLALYLGREKLDSGRNTTLLLVAPFDPKTVTIFSLPLRIANVGGKTAHDISLIIRLPEAIHAGINEVATRNVSQFDLTMKMEQGQAKLGHFDFQSFSFSAINPRSAAAVEEPFALAGETRLTVPIQLKRAQLAVDVEYGVSINITVAQADAEPVDYAINLIARRAHNEAELEQQIDHYVHAAIVRNRDKSSWYSYFIDCIARRSETVVIAPTTIRVSTPVRDGAVVQASSFAESIGRIRYSPTAIRLLFTRSNN